MIRAAIVGLGNMGVFHGCLLKAIPDVELKALVDPDKSRLATARSLGLEAPCYPSLNDLLEAEQVDALLFCTPTYCHQEQVEKALAFSCDVFCEKRVALTAEGTRVLAELAAARRRVTSGGYMFAYNPAFSMLRRLLEEGAVGDLVCCEATLFHSELFARKRGWQFEGARSGGGVISNPGAHLVFLLYHLFGKPQDVHSRLWNLYSDVEDTALARLHYGSGLEVKLLASWSVPRRPVLEIKIVIGGSQGTLRWSRQAVSLERPGKCQTWTTIELEPKGIVNLAPENNGEAYFLEMEDFFASCRDRRQPITTFQRCAEAEALMDDIYSRRVPSDKRGEIL